MTVIAWDGHSLAADRRACSGNGYYSIVKIARCAGSLVGVSGRGDRIREFQQWLCNGEKQDLFPKRDGDEHNFTALVIRSDGVIHRFESSPHPLVCADEQHAIGCGGIVARALMHVGQSAKEAVETTMLFDENCGNGVDVLEFEGVP